MQPKVRCQFLAAVGQKHFITLQVQPILSSFYPRARRGRRRRSTTILWGAWLLEMIPYGWKLPGKVPTKNTGKPGPATSPMRTQRLRGRVHHSGAAGSISIFKPRYVQRQRNCQVDKFYFGWGLLLGKPQRPALPSFSPNITGGTGQNSPYGRMRRA